MSAPKSLSLRLSLLSPVSISGGKEHILYPDRDFFYHAGHEEVCYVDPGLLENALKEARKWEAYEQELRTRRRQGEERFTLQGFLPDALGGGPDDWEGLAHMRRPALGMRSDALMPLHPVPDGNQPITTELVNAHLLAAMVYDWLSSEKESSGKDHLTRIANGASAALEACRPFSRELGMLREVALRRPRTLTQYDRDRLQGLESELQAHIDHQLGFSAAMLLGEEEPFEWESLEVTDNSPLVVQATRRLAADGRLLEPYYEELVPAGTLLSTRLKVVDSPSHPHLRGWIKNPEEELAGVLFDYAYDSVEFEREQALFVMEESQLPAYAQRNYEELKRYYDNLLFDELDEATENEAYLWLGSGPDPIVQAMGLALYHVDPEAFHSFRQLGALRFGEDPFPYTRRVTVTLGAKRGRRYLEDLGVPLGWVKVKIGE